MKKNWLTLASLAVLAIAVLGYTLVYASNASVGDQQTEVVSDEAPAKAHCPWAAKMAAHEDGQGCTERMKELCGKKSCDRGEREECRTKCDGKKQEAEAEAEAELEFN